MRSFDYSSLFKRLWDTETMNLTNLIHEYKGKQDLYIQQKPDELEKLVVIAKVQSTESSNRMEGVKTTSNRIKSLMAQKTTPRNRDEKEIAGYRDVLNTIHENHQYIPVRSNYILQLHRDLMQYTGSPMGGRYKAVQNYLEEEKPDGTKFIRFTPVAPYETEPCMNAICEQYQLAISRQGVDPLLLIPVFIADFLCIHPFSDGNGRMSRLLTLLLLYRAGYVVGRYISIEKHIEKTKEVYYQALDDISQGWHEATSNPEPFIKYMLGVILGCYREFEERVTMLSKTGEDGKKLVKASATDVVRSAIQSKIGRFTKSEIMDICPTLSRSSVEAGLRELIQEGEIQKYGAGPATYYLRSDAIQ